MNKALFSITGLAILFCFGRAGAVAADGVAAIVNKQPITEAELDMQVGKWLELTGITLKGDALTQTTLEIRREKLHALISRLLVIQEFKNEGRVMPESYIDGRVADIVKKEFGGDSSAFKSTLAERGITLEHYRGEIRDNAIIGYMRNQEVSEKLKSANQDKDAEWSSWTTWIESLREKASVKILDKDLREE